MDSILTSWYRGYLGKGFLTYSANSPETIFEELYNAAGGLSQAMGFYFESAMREGYDLELKSVVFDFRNKSNCISKIERISSEPNFRGWAHHPSKPAEVIRDWMNSEYKLLLLNLR